jgi:PAS domain S-box-containing protein
MTPPKQRSTATTSWEALKSVRHIRRSVRGKMVGLVLLTTFIVLLVSGIAILIHDLAVYRSSWASDVATEANILALSTAPAMAFDNHEIATRDLEALQARRYVRVAALYKPDGSLYAQYVRTGELPPPRRGPPIAEGIKIRGERVEIAQRISYNKEVLGTIYLSTRYDVISRVRAYLGIFAFIAGLSLPLALTLSALLQRRITVPLEAIADVARQIVRRRDYSLRVAHRTEDEIGIVVEALNNMLNEVEVRTQALEKSNVSLRNEIAVRQAAETALARANARLESTMAAAEIGGWIWDLQSGEFTADRNFAALHGVIDDAEANRDPKLWLSKIHPQDAATVENAGREALQTGALVSTEFRIVLPNGSIRWVISRGRAQFDAEGAPRLFAGLLIDVTAQKLAEQQRRDSERVYRAIGESIDYGVWLADAAGRNTYASESFLRLTGLSQEQYSEFGWDSVLHPGDAEATLAAWRECVRSGHHWYREHRIRGTDGKFHPILTQGVPVRRDDGMVYAWAGINLDISRLKRTEEALREADRRKDEFLATLAHELRNPLAPIRHATHLLGTPEATDAQHQWARAVIARQVDHMALLLDDLLDVSRITRGRLELRRKSVGLRDLVGAAVETARPLVEAKRHRLQVQLPTESVELNVDPLRISQALSNLLTNAAKFTDAGGEIVLAAHANPDGVTIAVSDSGIGLSAEAIPNVFNMFAQIDDALERSQGGLGIGLALAQGLVELHGGAVEATSDGPGHGSTFTVRLPPSSLVHKASQTVARTPHFESPGSSHCKILVADDNRDAADSLAMLLNFMKYEVMVAYSGRQALDLALRARPRILILDIGMPELSGYQIARRIREEKWGTTALLIALTGWGQQEDLDRAKSAGFDHHFSKPVDIANLKARLAMFGGKRDGADRRSLNQ